MSIKINGIEPKRILDAYGFKSGFVVPCNH